ncbi:MAG TPA: hypothetical protein VHP36_10500 [Chitinispirillaceae bacterium]|nr:hypothetical protein [Chitinispirillaceae bacterium]
MKIFLSIMIVFFISCDLYNQSGNLKKANKAELLGNYPEALSLYTETLLKITSAADAPDAYRSKFVQADLWKKEIEKHIIWLNTPAEQLNKDFNKTMEAVLRCADKVHTENSLAKIKIQKYSADQFGSDWKAIFFDPMIQADASYASILNKNYNDNFSIFTLTAPANYNYDINLINKNTGKKITFKLFPESSRSILIVPGEYLLICRSTITFQTNQVWYSQYSAFQLTFPQEASKITSQLRTSVAKERIRG